MKHTFDYIVVGAGTAGCVLANRLSADPAVRVLLIEAGGWDRGWRITMPAALAYPMQDAQLNWGYFTEPQKNLQGRRIHWPRGRVIGGSSSINGMVYVRGHALDFERWEVEGATGWGWANVLPYFKRSQSHISGEDNYRGGFGPVHVRTGSLANPLCQAWLDAGRQAGYPITEDINGFQQEGFGILDMTIYRGRRWGASRADLAAAGARPNLSIRTGSLVRRVNFCGTAAVGVSLGVDHDIVEVRADREVILCSGAINSPQLLQLSGIGDAAAVRKLAIGVVADLPGVGRNLQDHLCVYVQHECATADSLASVLRQPAKSLIGLRWLLTRGGPGASNHFDVGAFIRSGSGVRHPDLQHHFLALAAGYEQSGGTIPSSYQVDVDALRPESRGTVTINSAAADVPPVIDPNYLASHRDRQVIRDAVTITREIFAQPAFNRFRKREIAPGPGVRTAAEVDRYVRATAQSAYHPSCTCRMGQGSDAVVDPQCRVYGVERLRVVDASVMPSIVSGNLNAATYMIAERAADFIAGKSPLPPSQMPYHVAPDWREAQR